MRTLYAQSRPTDRPLSNVLCRCTAQLDWDGNVGWGPEGGCAALRAADQPCEDDQRNAGCRGVERGQECWQAALVLIIKISSSLSIGRLQDFL